MKLWFANSWESLRSSFWFIPSLMVAGAIVLAFGMLNLDRALGTDWLSQAGWVEVRGPEGARALLSAVANSMMTIASLTFSMTIVTLQLASSQFGPRLLRNFIRDRGNQAVLGAFIATFAYCLMVLRAVNGTEEHQFVPEIAITVGMGLAMASLGVLIYFIHHIALSIQAGTVIARVGEELHDAIQRLYPEEIGHGEEDVATAADSGVVADFRDTARIIEAMESNYLQSIDSEGLMELAVKHDLTLKIHYRPGQFVMEGSTLVSAWPEANCDDASHGVVQDAFYFGPRRTLVQDVEFAVNQLVEIAVRALSPGINDPFTASACVDRLSAAIAELAKKSFPSALRFDDQGKLRVLAEIATPATIIGIAFHQIRQAAHANTAITLRLLDTIHALLERRPPAAFREALLHHAELIHQSSDLGLLIPSDKEEANRRYRSLLKR